MAHKLATRVSRWTVAIAVIALSLSLLYACDETMDYKHFSDTYTDILIIREQQADTSIANKQVDSILKAHGYTHESFKHKFEELSRRPEVFREVMDSVRKDVQKRVH